MHSVGANLSLDLSKPSRSSLSTPILFLLILDWYFWFSESPIFRLLLILCVGISLRTVFIIFYLHSKKMGSQGSVWTHDVTSLYKKLKYTDFAPHHVQPLAAWPSSFGLQLTARSWTVASCRKWRLGHSHSQCMSMQSMSHWKRYQNMPTWIQLDFMKVIIVRIYVDICGL